MTTRVILDCDPGHDDALAILLAARNLDLRAITTVAGNQTLAKTTLNARRMCTVAGILDMPIAAGLDRPLAQAPLYAEEIHGDSGLDGPHFPPPTVDVDPRSALQLATDVLTEPTTIIATGPLTNVATLLRNDVGNVDRIVLMGGSTGRGNMAPLAEFNILADPEAADIVFRSGVPVTMCGLDVTHQALATPQVLDRVAALGTPLARICHQLLTFFADSYRAYFGFESPPLHDPVAVAAVIDPTVISARPVNVEIELTGTHTRGATVVDLHRVTGRKPNALVATGLNVDRFWDLMIGAIR
ncbi:nucleoside hydrolase [Kutzneria kofuensis]|uniref:Purine nucleosidase/pyrimidine-specific ribonucleoside hydrolase n=1 Tax=Kutzneria kofuensis TaxID=103725 RepID=A0A7W9NEB5_9PSEU|nr:nucleoside hydrolase [Kutzneria kofuensis]MBB5889505.1 purine nucleosidase/pyrimidine-specific ribonucleoside hydrolase [Kutzneria kofuensis]